jgi:large subunit ribosomal protein L29
MAKTATAGELRGQTQAELKAKVTELKEELFTLRFQSATGQLESHGRLRAVRKDIARIYTVLQERTLGITDDPDAGDASDSASDSEPAAATVTRVKASSDE